MAMASWLTPTAKNGTGNKTIGLTASKNTGASRTTIVTVSVSGITKTINCTQMEADKFTIKISALTTNSSGTTITNVGDCSIGASATGGVKEGTYYRDTSVTLTAKAAPTGYDFVGWYEGYNLVSTSLSFAVTLTANRTLVAKYKIKSYTVNATSENTNKGTVSPAGQTVEHGKNATVTASRKTGYKFDGWYNGSTKVTSTNPYTFAPTANITLTAKWAINTVSDTIKISPSGGGTVSPNPIIGQENTEISTTATPATGYNFKHWRYNNLSASGGYSESTTNPLKFTVTGKRDVTAVFELKSYTVTWNANGGTVSPASVSKTHGSTLGTLPTPTRAADVQYTYTFKGWFTTATGGTQVSASTTVTGNVTYYAQWAATLRSYTVTFNGNGGGTPSPSTITKTYGSELGTLPTCSRAGYTFLGWYTASSGGTKISSTTKITGTVTYYAQWSINSYTLTYNVNGGNAVSPTSKSVQYGSAYGTLPTPTKNSNAEFTYAFAGWYTAASGGTQVTANTTMGAGNTTIYAHWTATRRSYTIGYQTTYGSLNRTSQSVAYGSKGSCTLTMPSNNAQYTYTFQGWYTAANGGGTKVGSSLTLETPSVAGAATYYAYVTRTVNSYTWTFNANGGTGNTTKTLNYNNTLSTLPTASKAADAQYTYTFVGWFDTSASTGGTQLTTSTKCTGNKTWYARYTTTINKYTFTFNANGGSTPSSSSITKDYNEAIGTLPTCSRAADNTYTYAFAGWFDTATATGGTQLTTTTKVTSNKTWYARWTATYKNYTVTWNGNGGTPSKSSSSFHYNDALGTLPTATRTGYTFKGWSTSNTGTVNVSTTTKVTANVIYYAVWTINSYTWTFDANGGTGDTTKTLNYNATLSTLPTASRASTAANNYTFAGWFDTDASTGGTQLTTSTKCTGNKTWYARWTASTRQYKLTVTAGTGGTVSGGGTYNYNASATLKATANSGYHFVKWSDGNTSATRTVTVTKDATYTATFEQDPYLNLDKTSLEFEASGGTQTVNITSNVSWTVS